MKIVHLRFESKKQRCSTANEKLKVNMTRTFLFAYCIKQTSLIMMANFVFANEASFLLERGFSNPYFAQKVSSAKRGQTVVYQTSVTHKRCVMISGNTNYIENKQVWRLRYPPKFDQNTKKLYFNHFNHTIICIRNNFTKITLYCPFRGCGGSLGLRSDKSMGSRKELPEKEDPDGSRFTYRSDKSMVVCSMG